MILLTLKNKKIFTQDVGDSLPKRTRKNKFRSSKSKAIGETNRNNLQRLLARNYNYVKEIMA